MERILTELRQMRLPGMAQTWQNLMETHQASSLNIIDGLRILLQGEHDMRRANRKRTGISRDKFNNTAGRQATSEITTDSNSWAQRSLATDAPAIFRILMLLIR